MGPVPERALQSPLRTAEHLIQIADEGSAPLASAGHLVLERVTAGYGGAPVLEDVSLSIETGECVAVWGRNGAGKTTLLRAISGLIRPSSGTITIDGVRIDALA